MRITLVIFTKFSLTNSINLVDIRVNRALRTVYGFKFSAICSPFSMYLFWFHLVQFGLVRFAFVCMCVIRIFFCCAALRCVCLFLAFSLFADDLFPPHFSVSTANNNMSLSLEHLIFSSIKSLFFIIVGFFLVAVCRWIWIAVASHSPCVIFISCLSSFVWFDFHGDATADTINHHQSGEMYLQFRISRKW